MFWFYYGHFVLLFLRDRPEKGETPAEGPRAEEATQPWTFAANPVAQVNHRVSSQRVQTVGVCVCVHGVDDSLYTRPSLHPYQEALKQVSGMMSRWAKHHRVARVFVK